MPEDTELLASIDRRLALLVQFVAASRLDGLTKTERIQRLCDMGLNASEISDLTGISPTTVAPIASKYRKSQHDKGSPE